MRFKIVLPGLTAGLAALFFLVSAPAGPAPAKEEPLAVQVREAITKGKAFLRQNANNGAWDFKGKFGSVTYPPGGTVSLALLALLTCGVENQDDRATLDAGLKYLRGINSGWTYVVSLQTMVYALNGDPNDKDAIKANVQWLLDARLKNGYWSYQSHGGPGGGDASNTQYALLALHEAIHAGVDVPKAQMESIRKFYQDSQTPEGGWPYEPGEGISLTMTTAGLCGLLITGMDLEEGHKDLNADGSDPECGVYAENAPVVKALGLIGDLFPGEAQSIDGAGKRFANGQMPVPFYGLYGIERAGRLSGLRFIGGHDWYRVGCKCLVSSQHGNGSWGSDGLPTLDGQPIVATSFALLFLGKGRTPVLMTKLAYGPRGDEDWHHKHNDMRNVVEQASKELFKKQPMAWQNFDTRDIDVGANAQLVHDLTEQLLESPIVFISGHDSVPDGMQKDVLKEYLENGGFVFAEACCGEKNHPHGFGPRFGALMKEIYPDADLKLLDDTHPIYSASGRQSSSKDFPLYGIERGCKTIVVYSPNAISGYWEANDTTSDKGGKAFLLADNVIAYATGLEPPRQKGDSVKIADSQEPPIRRGYLKTAQLKHGGQWQPAPKAMHNLMIEARAAGLDVSLEPSEIGPGDPDVVNHAFLYMHGRGDFSFSTDQLKPLRFALEEKHAVLFADACCGSKAFDAAFRRFIDAIWADAKEKPKLEPIPPDDELYSAALNGQPIKTVKCRREKPDGSGVDPDFQDVKPELEGVKINGRWVVIYSRYDIGCALEHHPTPGCLGHDYGSAVALGRAAVLYALKR